MTAKFSICLSLFLLVLFTSCFRENWENSKNDLQQLKIRGHVKSIDEFNYASSGKCASYISFSKDGFILEQSLFNPDGSLIRRWKFDYDSLNLKLSRQCFVGKDSLSYTLLYDYNKNHKLIRTKIRKLNIDSGLLSTILYDSFQNKQDETNFGITREKEFQTVYFYDSLNRVKKEEHHDFIQNRHWTQRYTYNKQNLVTESIYKTLGDTIFKRVCYTYDPAGLVNEVTEYTLNNVVSSITSYKYDQQGNVIKENIHQPNGQPDKTLTSEFKYDKFKNWVFVKNEDHGKIISMITRKIQYYK